MISSRNRAISSSSGRATIGEHHRCAAITLGAGNADRPAIGAGRPAHLASRRAKVEPAAEPAGSCRDRRAYRCRRCRRRSSSTCGVCTAPVVARGCQRNQTAALMSPAIAPQAMKLTKAMEANDSNLLLPANSISSQELLKRITNARALATAPARAKRAYNRQPTGAAVSATSSAGPKASSPAKAAGGNRPAPAATSSEAVMPALAAMAEPAMRRGTNSAPAPSPAPLARWHFPECRRICTNATAAPAAAPASANVVTSAAVNRSCRESTGSRAASRRLARGWVAQFEHGGGAHRVRFLRWRKQTSDSRPPATSNVQLAGSGIV